MRAASVIPPAPPLPTISRWKVGVGAVFDGSDTQRGASNRTAPNVASGASLAKRKSDGLALRVASVELKLERRS